MSRCVVFILCFTIYQRSRASKPLQISLIKTAEGMAQSKKIEAEALETEAEGFKRAAIKEAEGKKITLVKEAEGKAEAIEIEVQF